MKTAPFQIQTDLDYPHLLELHRVVDGILAPKCLRKKQRFNVAISVIDIAVGIFCVQMTGKLWVAVMFGLLALAFLAAGIFYFQIAARTAQRQMDKRVFSTNYTLEAEGIRSVNRREEKVYPYHDCGRLVETEENLYYVTQKGEVVMLDKSTLQGGGIEELRAWLSEKCGRPVESAGPDWKIQKSPEKN